MFNITKLSLLTALVTSSCAYNHVPIVENANVSSFEKSYTTSDKSFIANNEKLTPPPSVRYNSNYFTAVSKPGYGNDYPVTYRIQIPDLEDRVRPIDRPLLVQPSSVKSD